MENLVLYGKTIAFLATDGVEQIELTAPWTAIKNAGGTVKLVSPKIEGTIRGVHHDVPGDEFLVDVLASDAIPEEYDALVLPGGVFSPDALRLSAESVQFVRSFFDANKPVAAICHGAWMLIEADVIDGRKLTSWPSLRTDIVNAGGTWFDEACVCDEGLITSRCPDDLPKFCEMAIKEFAKGVPAIQPVLSEAEEQPGLFIAFFGADLYAFKSLPYMQTQDVVYGEVHGTGLLMDTFDPTGVSTGLANIDLASGS